MTASYQTNLSPTALYISNITNNKNELWKPARLTSFQKPQLQSVLIFKLVHPCPLLYQLAVLFILSFNILSHSFDVLHSRCLNFDEFPDSALYILRDGFTGQRMLINQNAVFLPGHAVSSMQAIWSCHNVVKEPIYKPPSTSSLGRFPLPFDQIMCKYL